MAAGTLGTITTVETRQGRRPGARYRQHRQCCERHSPAPAARAAGERRVLLAARPAPDRPGPSLHRPGVAARLPPDADERRRRSHSDRPCRADRRRAGRHGPGQSRPGGSGHRARCRSF